MPSSTSATNGFLHLHYVSKDIHSESTLPLLNYFVGCRQSEDPQSEIFNRVKSLVGEQDRPIPAERELPDESAQLETTLINLINNGPGKKPPGKPTVSQRPRIYPSRDLVLTVC